MQGRIIVVQSRDRRWHYTHKLECGGRGGSRKKVKKGGIGEKVGHVGEIKGSVREKFNCCMRWMEGRGRKIRVGVGGFICATRTTHALGFSIRSIFPLTCP